MTRARERTNVDYPFLVGFANANNSDMPMAPMDMDDEGDVISEGEE